MVTERRPIPAGNNSPRWSRNTLNVLSRDVVTVANRGVPHVEFFNTISELVLRCADADAVELWGTEDGVTYHWVKDRSTPSLNQFGIIPKVDVRPDRVVPVWGEKDGLASICRLVALGASPRRHPCFTPGGSFWVGDTSQTIKIPPPEGEKAGPGKLRPKSYSLGGEYASLAVTAFNVGDRDAGVLIIKSRQPRFYNLQDVETFEAFAQTVGLAAATRRAQVALRERIKELTCLYGISQLTQTPDIPLEEVLRGIAALLPPAFQYPEYTCARIFLDDACYTSPAWKGGLYSLTSEIVVAGQPRGGIEVSYHAGDWEHGVSPFLREEQNLLDAVAQQVALLVERRHTAEDKARLEAQLRHADRLATIGQLAAGVAHELNEPLANILGYAQLVHKTLPDGTEASHDAERIISSALHAREVVRKLLIFGRQLPARENYLDVNAIVRDGIYFLEARCAHEGLKLVKVLEPDLPRVWGDQTQIHQVLVNLLVNAIQATPAGGTITIATRAAEGYVELVVADTGHGIPPDIIDRIFLPFFTTKDVGQGTGLGLSVVHGIVSQLGGSINVWSEPGRGARFEVRFPAAPETSSREARL